MVEGTPLLRVQTGNCLEGSNPFVSATYHKSLFVNDLSGVYHLRLPPTSTTSLVGMTLAVFSYRVISQGMVFLRPLGHVYDSLWRTTQKRSLVTTLSSITQNHLSLECECGHSSLLPVSQLLETLLPETTVHQVADRARCSRCKRTGFIEMRIVYVGASHVALEATRFGKQANDPPN